MSDKVADTPSQSRRWTHHVGKFEEKFRSGFCSTAGDSDKGQQSLRCPPVLGLVLGVHVFSGIRMLC